VPWQGISFASAWRAEKATQNPGDNAAKYQQQTATVYDVILQTVQEMQ